MTTLEKKLRSNFPEGTTRWAVRRAEWKSVGIGEEDFRKPKIAIINSSSDLGACYAHLDRLVGVVKVGIRDAGGVGFEIRTIAPMDFGTGFGRNGRYLLPSRDLLVNDIEVMVEGAQLDGMVLLSSCDKTVPGHLMAAGRLDIPAIVLACGYQSPGVCEGKQVDIEDVYEQVGAQATGRISMGNLTELCDNAIGSPGVCAGLGTANTMQMISEALGMSLPGSTPIWAGGRKLREFAYQSGQMILKLIERKITPRMIMTRESFENAVMLDLAIGGSLNAVRHLGGIATEAQVMIDILATFEKYQDRIPLLTRIRPNGRYRIEDLERAGGTRAVMSGLRTKLNLDSFTVSGNRVEENLGQFRTRTTKVVGTYDNPAAGEAGIRILRGTLAPEGALVKVSAVPKSMRKFEGRGLVFDDEEEALKSLEKGFIKAGSVVILRNLGPKGGPGTVFAANFIASLSGSGLSEEVGVVTDGEISGLNHGLVVGQVMPEAAEDGPLAYAATGDEITIDVDECTLNLMVSKSEINNRRKQAKYRRNWVGGRSWLNVYGKLVGKYSDGAVIDAGPPRA